MLELLGILGGVCIVGIVVSLKLARTSLERDPVGALLDAAFQGDTGTVTYLLDHGVDVNASRASAQGVTALHGAVMGNSRACVELLISRGADLEAHPARDPDGDRDTPLAHAVSQACDSVAQKDGMPGEESTEMVELLLAAGADPEPGLQALRPYQATDGNDTPLASLLRAAQRRRVARSSEQSCASWALLFAVIEIKRSRLDARLARMVKCANLSALKSSPSSHPNRSNRHG